MAKILAGTVEVAPKCALPWQALLSYMRSDQVIEEIIAEEKFPLAGAVFELLAQNIPVVDAIKLEEYRILLGAIENRALPEAIMALHNFRARVVPELIKEVVDCECER